MERALRRNGNVGSARDWRLVLMPIIGRYRDLDLRRFFPEEAVPFLEIQQLVRGPVGRPAKRPQRFYHSFDYLDKSWHHAHRVGRRLGAEPRLSPSIPITRKR